ncbi:MAG: hypothetical protein ACLFR8_00715 [Alkalispirochaeta sp.]
MATIETTALLGRLLEEIHPGQRVHPRTLRRLAGRKRWDTREPAVRTVLDLLQNDAKTVHRITGDAVLRKLVVPFGDTALLRRRLNPLERSRAVVDVNNVVWSVGGGERRLSSLYGLVAHLRRLGIREVIGVADANLPFVVGDEESLEAVHGLFDRFETVPAGTPADARILRVLTLEPGIVVTNDRFRDWRRTAPIRRSDLQRLLAPFIRRDDGSISLGDLEYELLDPE